MVTTMPLTSGDGASISATASVPLPELDAPQPASAIAIAPATSSGRKKRAVIELSQKDLARTAGPFRAAGPRAVALPAALQSRISGPAHRAPTRFSKGFVCAAVAGRRPSALTCAESGTGLAVYRLVQWLSRIGRPGPGDREHP